MDGYENVRFGDSPTIGEYVLLGVVPKGKTLDKLAFGDNVTIRSHSVIYAGNRIGDGFQTGHGVLIRENNVLGNRVSVGSHSDIGRENVIGDSVRIHSNCFIPEFVKIERGAWLGPGVTILNVLHPPCPKFPECAPGTVIGENAKIGGNVTLAPRVKIGKNSLIGAGSTVTKDVPDDVVAVGCPARVIKPLDKLECVLGCYDTPYEWEER